jgi:hypothetical protein
VFIVHLINLILFYFICHAALKLPCMKRDIVLQKGISLVAVPCWWDGTVERYIFPAVL